MAMTDKEKIDKFIHSYINDDFGLSIDDLVPKVKPYGRFRYWLGGDSTKIKKVLQAVKSIGVSAALFAAYEKNEGYNSSWGWLNHTTPQGNYLTDAKFVANKIVAQSKQSGTPSWVDAGNPVNFVPASVVRAGNEDFRKNMKAGTVGRAYIPLTAAATWAAYYPKGLNASYNGVQNYGNPFLDAANTILAWGGKIDGKGGSASSGSSSSGNSGNSGNSNNPFDLVKKSMEAFLQKIQDAMKWDVHSVGGSKFFSNKSFSLQKTFNNTYRIKMNASLIDAMKNLMDRLSDMGSSSDSSSGSSGDSGSSGGKPVKGKSVLPNGKSGRVIGGNWTYNTLPKKYKEAIKIPIFKPSYLNNSGNTFPRFGDTGQCTELTQSYMTQLWGKVQPADDGLRTNGQRVWVVYKNKGAKTTHNPTVGYGFSSKPPYLQASLAGVGHTGVVVAVFDDGSFLTANYNVPPYWAPSRVVEYALIDGVPKNAGDNIVFFSGIK